MPLDLHNLVLSEGMFKYKILRETVNISSHLHFELADFHLV